MCLQEGTHIRAISRLTNLSRNTIRRALRQQAQQHYNSSNRTTKLEQFKPYIEKRHKEYELSAVHLLEETVGGTCVWARTVGLFDHPSVTHVRQEQTYNR